MKYSELIVFFQNGNIRTFSNVEIESEVVDEIVFTFSHETKDKRCKAIFSKQTICGFSFEE